MMTEPEIAVIEAENRQTFERLHSQGVNIGGLDTAQILCGLEVLMTPEQRLEWRGRWAEKFGEILHQTEAQVHRHRLTTTPVPRGWPTR